MVVAMSSPATFLFAAPPPGTVILMNPLSELRRYITEKKCPNLKLIIRVIKALMLYIFRGHFYDRMGLITEDGILSKLSGKVKCLSFEKIQSRYFARLETSRFLILKKPESLPKPLADKSYFDYFAKKVNASTISAYLFGNPKCKTKDLVKSPEFIIQKPSQESPSKEDVIRGFQWVVKKGSVKDYITYKANFNITLQKWFKESFTTVFELALESKNIPLARYLVKDKDENVEGNSHGFIMPTPLHNALALGDIRIIKGLLKREAKQNALDGQGNNMMHYAALSGKIEVVKLVSTWNYLKGYKKQPHQLAIPEAFWAAQSGNLDCLKFMLKNPPNSLPLKPSDKPNPNQGFYKKMSESNHELDPLKHISGKGTILHYAAQSGNPEMVKYLIRQGVSPFIENAFNDYPIHEAAGKGDLETVKYLWPFHKRKGVKVGTEKYGSLLSEAVDSHNPELVKYLLAEGTSLKSMNKFGVNVLDRIKEPSYLNFEIKKLILDSVK